MKQILIGIVCTLVLVGLAACGGDNEPEQVDDQPRENAITVEMHDIYFGNEASNVADPPVWTASAGSEMDVVLENLGNLEHNWAVVRMDAEVPEPYTGGEDNSALFYWHADPVPAGETQTFPFSVPEDVGEYLVICTVAGHYPSMQGRLVVE